MVVNWWSVARAPAGAGTAGQAQPSSDLTVTAEPGSGWTGFCRFLGVIGLVLTMALVMPGLASPGAGMSLILVLAALAMVLNVPEYPRLFGFS